MNNQLELQSVSEPLNQYLCIHYINWCDEEILLFSDIFGLWANYCISLWSYQERQVLLCNYEDATIYDSSKPTLEKSDT